VWPQAGLPVSSGFLDSDAVYHPRVVLDNSGGLLAVWMQTDVRPTGSEPVVAQVFGDINAQRVTSDGTLAWNGGQEITMAGANPSGAANEIEDMELLRSVVPDGVGGVIVGWEGWNLDREAYFRRFTASGTLDWELDMSSAPGNQRDLTAQADGAGGVIATWVDERSGTPDVYAQSVLSSGAAAWAADGVQIAATAAHRDAPQITPDGAAGAFVVWEESGSVHLQRLDASGSPPSGWGSDGVLVSGDAGAPRMASDGASGAIVVWRDRRSGDAFGLYAQRIDASGAALWNSGGMGVASAAGSVSNRYLVRLGFEDLAPLHALIADEYESFGVRFQTFGLDGSQSFWTYSLPPMYESFNWSCFPTIGMTVAIPSPWGFNFSNNVRHVNFDQDASSVSLLVSSGQTAPISSHTRLNVWDSKNGGGSPLLPEQLVPSASHRLVEFSTGSDNIASMTIKNAGNKAGFDELTFDSGTTPRGGDLAVATDVDGLLGASLFLDGEPQLHGNAQGVFNCDGTCVGCETDPDEPFFFAYTTPHRFLSLPVGKHLVSLYAPGFEWHQEYVDVWWGEEAAIDAVMVPVAVPRLHAATVLSASSGPIDVGGRAVPDLVDFNNDGRKDLVVGNAAGDLIVFDNVGTDAIPSFEAGATILSGVASNASPIMLDYYADGLRDLLVGYGDGTVRVYLNTGSMGSPSFEGTVYDTIVAAVPTTDAVPFMVDWDNDGKKDLLVGGADGNVYFFGNERLDASPAFGGWASRTASRGCSGGMDTGLTDGQFVGSCSAFTAADAVSASTSAAATIIATVSANAAPAAVLDWDGDGKKDLVVGDADGQIQLFLNEGTDDAPLMGGGSAMTFQNGSIIDVGSFARPIVADFNNDFVKDILVGNEAGWPQISCTIKFGMAAST